MKGYRLVSYRTSSWITISYKGGAGVRSLVVTRLSAAKVITNSNLRRLYLVKVPTTRSYAISKIIQMIAAQNQELKDVTNDMNCTISSTSPEIVYI